MQTIQEGNFLSKALILRAIRDAAGQGGAAIYTGELTTRAKPSEI